MATTRKEAPVVPIKPPPKKLGPVGGIVKIIAILVGFVITVLSLMACIGAFTANGYARVLVALAVAFVIPLVLADRLLPDDTSRAKGLVSDVVALVWLGFALVFVGALGKSTRELMTREGDRLTSAGFVGMAKLTYFLAGVKATIPEPIVSVQPAAAPDTSAPGAPDAGSAEDAGAAVPVEAASDSGADAATDAAPADAGADGAATLSQKGEKTPAELFKLLAPSVVTIFVKGAAEMQGGGTGFVLDSEGTIATNHHVIEGSKQIRIKFHNGATFDDVDLLTDNAPVDLALLRVDLTKPLDAGPPKPEAPPVTLGDSDAVVVGERAISIGNPLGLEHTLTDGLISSRRIYESRAWIQMSVPVSPGNSGGPLFNMRGEVIGVTTAQIGAGFGRAQNLNLAVPVNELKKLIRSEYPQKRKFGDSASSTW